MYTLLEKKCNGKIHMQKLLSVYLSGNINDNRNCSNEN